MAFSNQPLDSNSIPIANVYVQNGGFIATQGSLNTDTDGLGNTSTAVNMNLYQVGSESTTGIIGIDSILINQPLGILKVVAALNNGSAYDEPRGNMDGITLVNASSVTTLQSSALQVNYNGRGAFVIFDMIDASASPSVTCAVYGYEPVTGVAWTILAGLPITANGTYVYRIYPGLNALPNATVNDILPRTWGVWGIANNANQASYKICAVVMV